MTVELGVIEGRFGTPWSWEERSEVKIGRAHV